MLQLWWTLVAITTLMGCTSEISAQTTHCAQNADPCGSLPPTAVPFDIMSGLGSECMYVHVRGLPCVATVTNASTGTYADQAQCTIQARQAITISATSFATEECCDYVTVNGREYSGSVGPMNVDLAQGANILWSSDVSITEAGWTICATSTAPCCAGTTCSDNNVCATTDFTSTEEPTYTCGASGSSCADSLPASDELWLKSATVADGCEDVMLVADESCVEVLASTRPAGCTLTAQVSMYITADVFNVFDADATFAVNGEDYSGTSGPHHVLMVPGDEIRWFATDVTGSQSWTICATPPPSSPCCTGLTCSAESLSCEETDPRASGSNNGNGGGGNGPDENKKSGVNLVWLPAVLVVLSLATACYTCVRFALTADASQVNTQVMTTCLVVGGIAVIFGIAAVSYPGLYVIHSASEVASVGIWKEKIQGGTLDMHCSTSVADDGDKCVQSMENRCKAAKAFSVLGVLGGLVYVAATAAILAVCHVSGSRANSRLLMKSLHGTAFTGLIVASVGYVVVFGVAIMTIFGTSNPRSSACGMIAIAGHDSHVKMGASTVLLLVGSMLWWIILLLPIQQKSNQYTVFTASNDEGVGPAPPYDSHEFPQNAIEMSTVGDTQSADAVYEDVEEDDSARIRCVHCGITQIGANPKFCHDCGRPL
eukprot:m.588291 g.588291  ORF g.588291 m.588291 type:complete len:657 (-) comp22363_c0_seq4:672-2642(-)